MITLRKSADRGYADHGWLKSFHSFSFADYYDPRAHGLRQPARHQRGPHRARAPASARTATATWRSSATCSTARSRTRTAWATARPSCPGDVQRMSAGTRRAPQRVQPRAPTTTTHFLQIWIVPNARGIAPGYEQKALRRREKRGRLRLVASPDGRDGSVTIHADASIYAGLFDGAETRRAARSTRSAAPTCTSCAARSTSTASRSHAGDALGSTARAELTIGRRPRCRGAGVRPAVSVLTPVPLPSTSTNEILMNTSLQNAAGPGRAHPARADLRHLPASARSAASPAPSATSQSKGLPLPQLLAALTIADRARRRPGRCCSAFMTRWAALALARLHVCSPLLIFHNFWAVPAEQSDGPADLMFMKNLVDRRRLARARRLRRRRLDRASDAERAPLDSRQRVRRGHRRRVAPPMPVATVAPWIRALKVLSVLPWPDWLRWRCFFGGWVGYAHFARRRAEAQPSVLAATNRVRRHWMLQTTYREVRVIDGVVIQNLSTSPSFFASTTILIIGGLLAVLGTTEKASELVREIPFAARTSVLVFDLKLMLLLGDLRLRVLPLHLVDAAVHASARCWSRRRRRPSSSSERRAVARGLRRPGRPRRRHWPPRPSTTGCAPTTSRSPRSAGSSRRWCSCSRPRA